jgi:hypothetical protein
MLRISLLLLSSFQKTLKEEILYFLLDNKNHHSPFCSDREKSYPLCLYAVILSVSEESQPYKSFEKSLKNKISRIRFYYLDDEQR